jgi:hypothetical protein
VYDILVKDEEAVVVREIFDLYASRGLGAKTVAREMTSRGIRNQHGNEFTQSTVRHMLGNCIYRGILRSGDTYSQVFEHLRIVDNVTWLRTQELLESRKTAWQETTKLPRVVRGEALLSGNIICGHCGAHMTATSVVSRGCKVLRYICNSGNKYVHKCDGQRSYGAKTVDGIVTKLLLELFGTLADVSNVGILKRRLNLSLSENKAAHVAAIRHLTKKESELADLKSEVVKVIRGESKFSVGLLNEAIEIAEREVTRLREEVTALETALTNSTIKSDEFVRQHGEYIHWAQVFADADRSEQKMIAARMIERVEVRRGMEISVTWKADADAWRNAATDLGAETAHYSEEACAV